jgi:C4-type Zn-finger protein
MQGTITLADTTITFVISDESGQSAIFIQDGLSGKQWANQNLPGEAVRAALIVMLDGDEHEFDSELRELAESVQPADPELRFIP